MPGELRNLGGQGHLRTLLWILAFAAAVVGGVALGAVRSSSQPVDQPVFVRGTLTYAWHGDPARGCAAAGLCGTHGSAIVHFDGFGNLTSRGRDGLIVLDGASATVRVRRDDPSTAPGECVDTTSFDGIGVTLRRVKGRSYTAIIGGPVSAGRCAGPLASDTAGLRLAAKRLPGRNLGFDLRGSASFAAGPFSGELISTVMLRPDTADQQGALTGESSSSSSSSGGSPPRPPRVRHVLVEFATIRYRMIGATGALQMTFDGAPQPYCVPLDNCGSTGSVSVSVKRFSAGLDVSGVRTVPRRVGRRQAIADLRAGRLRPTSVGLFSSVDATIAETMVQAGAGTCLDTARSRIQLFVGGPFGPGRANGSIPAVLGGVDNGGDPLRTHCPGPSSTDIAGNGGPLGFFSQVPVIAQGSIARDTLGTRQIDVSLAKPGRFDGPAYAGQRGGSLVFSLTLTSVRGGTRRERVLR